jgi:hypothetical protein
MPAVAVFRAPNEAHATLIRDALRAAAIDAVVQSTGTAGYGPIEFTVVVPEDQAAAAQRVIENG